MRAPRSRSAATPRRSSRVVERAGLPCERRATLEAAVAAAFERAAPGDAVLLSPACASLDMFRNYGHRAEVFVAAVQALAEARAGARGMSAALPTSCSRGASALAPAPAARAESRGGAARRVVPEAIPVREWISVDAGQPARLLGFDRALVCVVIALLSLGLVMVYSASIALPDNPRFARYTPTYFLTRHVLSLVIAVVAALVVVQIPVAIWEKLSPWIFVASLLLLVVVLLPFVGKGVNGARRWIPLGIMSFQPSELTKLAIALYAAGYMVRRMDVKENFFRAVVPMAISIAVVGLLLLAEPDMGAFMVIATIAMGILFLGGVNGRMFLLISAVLIGAFVLMITLSDMAARAHLRLPEPVGRALHAGQGLPALAFADRLRPRRDLRPGPRLERREAALPARGAHRLPARRDRRGARLRRRRLRHRRLLLAGAAPVPHRPPGDRPRPRLRRPVRAGHRHLGRRPGLHQHGRQPRRAADQGADAAADELRRLGDRDEHGRAGAS